ncbi:MAG: hypothetical protein U1D55_06230 [Phycisphaerae bacterium]
MASSRFRAIQTAALLATIALGGLSLASFVCAGIQFRAGDIGHGWTMIAFGVSGAVVGTLLYSQVQILMRFANTSLRTHNALLDVAELLRRQNEFAHTLAENSTLSDWSKKLVFREKDYEFLRDTIHAAIVRQDWESAEHLIREMDAEFGFREEATRLREEATRARQATLEERIVAAVARFERLCDGRKWTQAAGEIERMQSLFPNEERIRALPQELELRRQQYKRNLLKEYDHAILTQDVDRAHQLLLALDPYLAPNEAAALKDSARGVFKAKLQRMGIQFSLAVSEKEFRKAIEVGDQLIREFPNSRFAHEIADMMPHLRQRMERGATADEPLRVS